MANSPALVLADEPTGNLDSKNSADIINLLRLYNKKYNQTLIVITHDEKIALQADRIIGIRAGKIVYDGPSAKVDQAALDSIYGEQAGAEECV